MSGPADLLLVFLALCGIGVLLPFLVQCAGVQSCSVLPERLAHSQFC